MSATPERKGQSRSARSERPGGRSRAASSPPPPSPPRATRGTTMTTITTSRSQTKPIERGQHKGNEIKPTQRFTLISRREQRATNLSIEINNATIRPRERANYLESKRNFSLTSSFLVNYLRWASLCSCCDMLSIYTLLMFVLLLSSFIEAQHHSHERGQPSRARGLSRGQTNWTGSGHAARNPAERTRWSASGLTRLGHENHDDKQQQQQHQQDHRRRDGDQLQQRPLSPLELLDEPLVEAGSEEAPQHETLEHYEILRVDKSGDLRAPLSQATPAARQQANHSGERLAATAAASSADLTQGSQSPAGQTKAAPTTRTTLSRRPQASQRRRPSQTKVVRPPSNQLARQGSHWIPVTGTPVGSSQAASALLDYPPPAQRPPAHAYAQMRPHPPNPVRRPRPVGDNNYAHVWPHRRPRFHDEPLDNELGPPPHLNQAGKLYKRVLLCDKTLVSLDYMRSSGNLLLPQPTFVPIGETNRLDEHEINEISDSFLDLENQLESSMSRLNLLQANRSSQTMAPTSKPNFNHSSQQQAFSHQTTSPQLNESSLAKFEPLSSSESSNMIQMERRSDYERHWPASSSSLDGNHLLSDEDPLVRCDMWDLEKGLKSRKPPRDILRMAIKADFDTVRDAINRCRQLSQRTLPTEDENGRDGLEMIMSAEDLVSLFSMKRGLMPGTKWCGLGDQASQYNDLGPKHRIDICCRAHDHCPIRSKPFRNDYGILNIGLYTKSHCDCDADFYRCLREVRSRTADMLGNLYFNVMKLQCMREERLQVCREAKPIALGFERCVRYEDQSPIKTVFKFTTPPVAY